MAARATIIIPTFGDAPFIRWALASAQAQTVREVEICVICDGSSPGMVAFVQQLAGKDRRVRVFVFPKGPRHGEIYRHQVITQETTGEIVCYLSHDDLYLPCHVESLERTLEAHDFVHSILVSVATEEVATEKHCGIQYAVLSDLASPYFSSSLLDWPRHNGAGFGLSFGAHTRAAYLRLSEGWSTTPADINTDVFMWQKFVRNRWCRAATHMQVTALNFDRAGRRAHWSPEQREAELAWWFPRTLEPGFRDYVTARALHWIAHDIARTKEALAIQGGPVAPSKPTRPTRLAQCVRDLWPVWRSGLFDPDWYVEQNADVQATGVRPLWHFLRWGGAEGRDPSPLFDSRWYREAYLLPPQLNPLAHYQRQGRARGCCPLPSRTEANDDKQS